MWQILSHSVGWVGERGVQKDLTEQTKKQIYHNGKVKLIFYDFQKSYIMNEPDFYVFLYFHFLRQKGGFFLLTAITPYIFLF